MNRHRASEPFDDVDPRSDIDPDDPDAVGPGAAAEQAAEESASGAPGTADGDDVTSASEGDPLDPGTPVDNLE
ncbi:hypothetical protein [Agromyces seonyuensis]|uniref:Uncharacterized protein n=1 Tax=Agromyces seonyuensis TaxID=2662446 RepID=A0A6I4P6S9_9MICO|nr:hypothetical protein [Agromyces seonyuensis]MWB99384.1 hypothetical protein [Agromyces seonyuensis]